MVESGRLCAISTETGYVGFRTQIKQGVEAASHQKLLAEFIGQQRSNIVANTSNPIRRKKANRNQK